MLAIRSIWWFVAVFGCTHLISAQSSVQPLTESQYQVAWTDWKYNYQQSFSSSEDVTRYQNFKQSLDYVRSSNSDSGMLRNFGSIQFLLVGLNSLSHLSREEFVSNYLGAVAPVFTAGAALSAGAIAGIVIAIAAVVAGSVAGGKVAYDRIKRKKAEKASHGNLTNHLCRTIMQPPCDLLNLHRHLPLHLPLEPGSMCSTWLGKAPSSQ